MMNNTNWTALAVSVIVSMMFGAMVIVLLVVPVPQANTSIVQLAAGALIGMAGTVVTYWMGSSAGSAAKDQTIANSVPGHLVVPATAVPQTIVPAPTTSPLPMPSTKPPATSTTSAQPIV